MPNSDLRLDYERHPIRDAPLDSTDMYTTKRVNQFVTDYKNYKDTVLKGTPEDPNTFSYYRFLPSPQAIQSVNLGAIDSSLCCPDGTTCLLEPYSSSKTPSSA